jgi:hypothetical protein
MKHTLPEFHRIIVERNAAQYTNQFPNLQPDYLPVSAQKKLFAKISSFEDNFPVFYGDCFFILNVRKLICFSRKGLNEKLIRKLTGCDNF